VLLFMLQHLMTVAAVMPNRDASIYTKENRKPVNVCLICPSDCTGASGAGKTTFMDVLAGRKTAGRTSGDIRVNGHPQNHRTFARVAGYVEQFDIHSPQVHFGVTGSVGMCEACWTRHRASSTCSWQTRQRPRSLPRLLNIFFLL